MPRSVSEDLARRQFRRVVSKDPHRRCIGSKRRRARPAPRRETSRGVLATALALVIACGGGEQTSEGTDASTTDPSVTAGTQGTDASDTDASETDETDGAALPAHLLVTADWLARTVSVLDRDALVSGAAREDALLATIDLAEHAPGPLELELVPDSATAIVAVGPGFFQDFLDDAFGFGAVPSGGRLLLIDLELGAVTAALTPAHPPMGIAVAPDGARAYTANYGDATTVGSTLSIVDLDGAVILEDVEIGARPEQVALDSTGGLGVVNLAQAGAIRTFSTDDVAGSLSPLLAVADDPSGVAFLDDSLVIVANSIPAGYSLVDVSTPQSPQLLETVPAPGGIPYAVTALPGRHAAFVSTAFGSLRVGRIDASSLPSGFALQIEVPDSEAFPLGIAVDPDSSLGFLGAPGHGAVHIVDLAAGELTRTIPWPSAAAPSYVAIR
ncbi:MAG: hypothetical protein KC636_19985 [Myxococcales bacterium]|nr:hypothetical protein [Myxococcales bacterium]